MGSFGILLNSFTGKFKSEEEIVNDMFEHLTLGEFAELRRCDMEELITYHNSASGFICEKYKLLDPDNPFINHTGDTLSPKHPDAVVNRILHGLWNRVHESE